MPHGYRSYNKRWYVLFALFWLNLVVQVIYIAFSPIATVSAGYYDVGLTAINWLSLVWLILFTPFTFLAGWAFDKYGIRVCLITAATGLTLATSVRCLSLVVGTTEGVKNSTFAYVCVMLGSFVAATVQPIVLASTTLMASTWFSVQQRNLANTVMAIANPLGLAVGSVLSPTIVPSANPAKIDTLLLVHFALAVTSVLVILPISDRPPTPPSNTAPVATGTAASKFSRALSSLGGNLPYIALCNIFALGVGAFTALLTVLEQAMEPQGYSPDDAGLVGAVLIICGIIGAGIAGPVLDRTRAYKLMIAAGLTLALPFMSGVVLLSQRSGSLAGLATCAGFMGLFSFTLLPASLDCSAEITYPINSGLSSGFLWSGSQLTAFVLVILVDGPLSEDTLTGGHDLAAGMWLLFGCLAAAVALSWLWTGRYLRFELEAANLKAQLARQQVPEPDEMPVVDAENPTSSSRALQDGGSLELVDVHMHDVQ